MLCVRIMGCLIKNKKKEETCHFCDLSFSSFSLSLTLSLLVIPCLFSNPTKELAYTLHCSSFGTISSFPLSVSFSETKEPWLLLLILD
ncbi:hypothetical protein K457DRAFT_867792 [Linnemannia elongata AG-77]|uniref:Uncharacterized protein n=1 Tax=Linnemannia elongata AG-77 TaxID=1314771 RepID=A0A197JG80_9FUNG|nr:hypothetical protein K457DRAFT_867792 [Linnemannia elongata AG-77]